MLHCISRPHRKDCEMYNVLQIQLCLNKLEFLNECNDMFKQFVHQLILSLQFDIQVSHIFGHINEKSQVTQP